VNARSLPGFVNLGAGHLLQVLSWATLGRYANELRRQLGMRSTWLPTGVRMARRGDQVLQAFSSTVVPNLPARASTPVVGYFSPRPQLHEVFGDAGWDEDLDRWIGSGESPVYVGFGSMPVADDRVLDIFRSSAERLGIRVLLSSGWSSVGATSDDRVRIVGKVDHDQVFPRCRAVVHHGGAGTTAAALTAGVPAVVCTVSFDQPFWADRVERLDAGVHLPFQNLSVSSLCAALNSAVEPARVAAASGIGSLLRAERAGQCRAADLIEAARPVQLSRPTPARGSRNGVATKTVQRAPAASNRRIDVLDTYQASRDYYQAELAAGVDRFFERRRENCPWCESTDLSVRLRTTDIIQGKPGRFVLERCGRCGHIFQNPRLSPAGLNFYYKDFYDGLGQAASDQIFKSQAPMYRMRARMLRPVTTPKAWLDVGTGYGHFCAIARKIWPDTVFDGLDQSEGVEIGARRGWIQHAYRGEFIALADELAGRYDVVSMHHYLEHTSDPFGELDTAARVLLPGGHLLIEVPDPDYRFHRALGRWWMPWFQPQHLQFFPFDNLVAALSDRGLVLVAADRGAAHVFADLTSSMAMLLNICAPDPTLPWLRAGPTRWRKARRSAAMAAAVPLFAATAILDALLYLAVRRSSSGNAYRILARKEV
jgi:SAM-dependent methyltransferase